MTTPSGYRREIDGLRALAVLPVIAFHAGFPFFRGGFIGVDVFFVISGFLITSLIVTEQARGTFSVARFYERLGDHAVNVASRMRYVATGSSIRHPRSATDATEG